MDSMFIWTHSDVDTLIDAAHDNLFDNSLKWEDFVDHICVQVVGKDWPEQLSVMIVALCQTDMSDNSFITYLNQVLSMNRSPSGTTYYHSDEELKQILQIGYCPLYLAFLTNEKEILQSTPVKAWIDAAKDNDEHYQMQREIRLKEMQQDLALLSCSSTPLASSLVANVPRSSKASHPAAASQGSSAPHSQPNSQKLSNTPKCDGSKHPHVLPPLRF
ncbi:hypothetical protein PM082_014719 [Marasmius tenuissimus]|nr:hypothetical protein PM082_014719 [Marasmius tenuissimus]